jgi:two-component system response regulator YesN
VYQLKICVADDEREVRHGIIQKIKSVAPEAEIYDVGFGRAALKGICDVIPDLAFLDIRMPEMDGLELLAEVRRDYPQIRLIMLTGYQEFEYARRALQLGASDFLLKPADRDQLQQIIQQAETDISRMVLAELEGYANELSDVYLSLAEIQTYNASLWFDSATYKKIRFFLRGSEELAVLGSEADLLCTFSVSPFVQASICRETGSAPGVYRAREEFQEAMLREWAKWESDRFFDKTRLLSRLPAHNVSKVLLQLRSNILSSARALSLSELESQLYEWLNGVSQLELKPLRKESACLMALLDEGLVKSNEIVMIDDDKIDYWLRWVHQFPSWNELKGHLQSIIPDAIQALKNLEDESALEGNCVDQAVAYIRQSPISGLSLENVAGVIGIHHVTLSRLFKRQTGVNFVQYVTLHRLQQAGQLLLSSKKPVREIAEEIGYTDYKYFCSLFKREFGVLPREYRNR